MRDDICGFGQRLAWAGKGSVPFGMFSCPGWRKPLTRLSDVFSASARRAYATGIKGTIVNVRSHSGGYSGAITLRFQPPGWHQLGAPGKAERLRLCKAASDTMIRCRTLCQVCSAPASDVLSGGVYCRNHAPQQFAFEVVQDKRLLRRLRRRWMNLAHATMTKCVWRGSGVSQPLYAVDGVYVMRIADALPGGRQQIFEAFIDQGRLPVELAGEWVFKIPKEECV